MNYSFKIEDKVRIIDRFGDDFFTKTSWQLEALISKWKVDDLQLINSFSANLVFKGISKIYGPVVIKFGGREEEFMSEVNALKNLNKSSICKLFDVDIENKVLLEEAILPGVELASEKEIERRLDVFCDLYS